MIFFLKIKEFLIFYSLVLVLSAIFHFLMERIANKWHAVTTNKIKPMAMKIAGQERINGYVCNEDEQSDNKI